MPAVDSPCDISVYFDVDGEQLQHVPATESVDYLKLTPDEALISIRKIGTFRVSHGREVVAVPAPEGDERLVQLCITGSITAVLLYQRRIPVLHAGAIAIGNDVVGFLGQSGEGKSSTTAALIAAGHRLLSDDLVPVQVHQTKATVAAGYPQIKISPEVAIALGYDPGTLIDLHPAIGKQAYRSEADFAQGTLPLKQLYILATGDDFAIDRLPPQAGITELLRHSYGSRTLAQGVPPGFHLLKCSEIFQTVPIYRLQRPRSLDLLPELAQRIEQNLLEPVA